MSTSFKHAQSLSYSKFVDSHFNQEVDTFTAGYSLSLIHYVLNILAQ